jgi:predicted ATPase
VPGRRLSQVERNLLEFWQNPPGAFDSPMLRQVRIEGGGGLRGIHRLVLSFPYPLTAICGRNGVGKSTVLALAALSASAPAGWSVFWGNTRPRTRPNARTEYVFSDFFHNSGTSQSLNGLRLAWVSMTRGNEVEYVREHSRGRWAHVIDTGRRPEAQHRPVREIDFVPMSRVLSAAEYGSMRSAFSTNAVPVRIPLTAESLAKLSYVMGRAYEEAEMRVLRGLSLQACRAGAEYSAFDMGGGEASVIALLLRMQSLPRGGLLLIEEIEVGLHAEAQVRLIEVLVRECLDRRLQVICTTHSDVVLDRLPREARVLLRKNEGEHEAVERISTRFAIHEMGGETRPELLVYTEDRFAATIVEEALEGSVRARIETRDVGSNVTLARQSVAHLRLNTEMRSLSVFDGDCTPAAIAEWVRSERADRTALDPEWLILPGEGLTPERWILREVSSDDYLPLLASELNCDVRAARAHVEAMTVQLDNHACEHTLSRRTGFKQIDARRALVRSVARQHPRLEELRTRIAASLR